VPLFRAAFRAACPALPTGIVARMKSVVPPPAAAGMSNSEKRQSELEPQPSRNVPPSKRRQ